MGQSGQELRDLHLPRLCPLPREDPTYRGILAACVGTGLRIGSRIELTEGERCSFLLESFEFPREETAFLFLVRSC